MKLSLVTTVLLLIVLSGATVQGKETVSGNSSVVSLTTGKAQGQVKTNCYAVREILLRNYGTKITSQGTAFSA